MPLVVSFDNHEWPVTLINFRSMVKVCLSGIKGIHKLFDVTGSPEGALIFKYEKRGVGGFPTKSRSPVNFCVTIATAASCREVKFLKLP